MAETTPKIGAIADRRQQSDVAASTALLAGLVMKGDIIQRILRQDIMKESVIFQELDAAAEAREFQRGVQNWYSDWYSDWYSARRAGAANPLASTSSRTSELGGEIAA